MSKRQAIFFLTDTQGANCVGAYSPGLNLGTPNLDRLAVSGLRFERACTCAPVCGPARSALLTGLYPHSNGVLGNDMAPHLDLPTLGQRLQRAGFATGYIGKWHLDGSDYFGSGRCPPGWDPEYWMDGRNYLGSLLTEDARALSRRVLGPEEVAENDVTAEFTHAHRIVERARRFIEANRDRDFFLVVSIDEPHHPHIAPEPYLSRFKEFLFPVPNADDDLVGKPRAQVEWKRHTSPLQSMMVMRDGAVYLQHSAYFACNSFSDSEVGRVLDAIDQHTPAAMVVYTSDHGDMFGSHGLHGKGPCMYEENIRVPLMIRWPGQVAPGSIDVAPVSHIDFVPTILDYFGIKVPDLLQGRSLLPRIQGSASDLAATVFVEFNRFEIDHDGFGAFSPIRCGLNRRFKLALNLLDTDEFYDLESDPLERTNRIDDPRLAGDRDRLHAEILEWMNRTRDPMRGPHWVRRPWSDKDGSTWGGPTRPRPLDEATYPPSLLYETGLPVDRYEYEKY